METEIKTENQTVVFVSPYNNADTQNYKKVRKCDDPDYFKKYYIQNRDKYKRRDDERKKQTYICDVCKCRVVERNRVNHETTAKHSRLQELMNKTKQLEEQLGLSTRIEELHKKIEDMKSS